MSSSAPTALFHQYQPKFSARSASRTTTVLPIRKQALSPVMLSAQLERMGIVVRSLVKTAQLTAKYVKTLTDAMSVFLDTTLASCHASAAGHQAVVGALLDILERHVKCACQKPHT